MMSTDQRHVRRPPSGPALLALAIFSAVPALAHAAAPVTAEEAAVSTGSWFCSRYEAAAAAGSRPAAAEVASVVRAFALGYVYGVSDAVGKPLPEAADTDRRIIDLLGTGCSQDGSRAVRDATLLAGRAMLEDARARQAGDAADAADATVTAGRLACRTYLDTRSAGPSSLRLEQVHNWADGYVNARFERAGRGLIPTAKNKALVLERFSAACAAQPSATVREAARSVAEATLPAR